MLNNCMKVHFPKAFVNKEPLGKACLARCDISLSLQAEKGKKDILVPEIKLR